MRQFPNRKRPGWHRGANETRVAASLVQKPENTAFHFSSQDSRIRAVRDGIEYVEHGAPGPRQKRQPCLSEWQRSAKGEAEGLGFRSSPLARLWDSDRWEPEQTPVILERKVVVR